MENTAQELDTSTPTEASNPKVKAVTESAVKLADSYSGYTVTTPAEYEVGAEHLLGIKEARKKVDEERFAITRPMDESKKKVMDFFRKFTDRLDDAETHVKKALATYQTEQERIAREKQRKEQEKADRQRRKLEEQAQAAREAGKEERAETLEERAENVTAAPAVVDTPKVKGVSSVEVWKFEITDPSLVPEMYKTIDEKKIGGVVRSLKGDTEIPGVRVYSEKSIRAGR